MSRAVFIIYSGNRDERRSLWEALREHGLRPWRDVEDLMVTANTPRDISAEITECQAVILWLSEDIFTSDFVANIEIPAVRAAVESRGIRVLPVFDGITPEEAETAASERWEFSVSTYNGHRLDHSNAVDVECATIAQRLVRVVLHDIAMGDPQQVVRGITRDDSAAHRDDAILNFDWRHAYHGGSMPDAQMTERLNTALQSSMTHLKAALTPGHVDLSLKTHLHVALAIGHSLRRPTGFVPRMERDDSPWTAEVVDTSVQPPLDVVRNVELVSATSVSVEVSITRDVTSSVDDFIRTTGRQYRARILLRPEGGSGQTSLVDPVTANTWARQVADEMSDLRSTAGTTNLDLFIACPVEFAVLLGWWLNATGPMNIYHWEANTGPYRRAWTLPAV